MISKDDVPARSLPASAGHQERGQRRGRKAAGHHPRCKSHSAIFKPKEHYIDWVREGTQAVGIAGGNASSYGIADKNYPDRAARRQSSLTA